MFDLIGRRRWFYIVSAVATVPAVIFILLTPLTGGRLGLQFSIDYTGGTVWEVHFARGAPQPPQVREVLARIGLPDSTVAITTSGDRDYVLIRTQEIGLKDEPTPAPGESPAATAEPTGEATGEPTGAPTAEATSEPTVEPTAEPTAEPTGEATAEPTAGESPGASPGASPGTAGTGISEELRPVARALEAEFGPIDEVRQESNIGPVISNELTQQALLLIVLGSAGILGWISFRFGDVRMGATAIAALVHDVIVVVGLFAILGTFIGLQIDALFVTAMLTVIGFSVHDTIVVFDRIRENRVRHAGEPFADIVNHSLLQTIGRSINTSLTTVIVLSALLLFGSEAIRTFSFALVVGIVSGTYSSIFNASALLVTWYERDERRRQRELVGARAR